MQRKWATTRFAKGGVFLVLAILGAVTNTSAKSSSYDETERRVVTGTVYVDRNANDKFDRTESGLVDVLVSNGRDVVRTDARGQYAIEAKFGDAVFVIKPRDHALPQRDGLLRFYRWMGRSDTSNLKYGGSKPQSMPKGEIDFALLPSNESNAFSALVFGDPQPNSKSEVDYFHRDIIEPLKGKVSQYAFGVSLGDIVNDDLSLHQGIVESTAQLQKPWHYVIGNHDLDFDADSDSDSVRSFESLFGPTTYAYQIAQTHFIVLDNVIHERRQGRPYYMGGLREDQFRFLEAYLAKIDRKALVVLMAHIPFSNADVRNPTFRISDQRRLLDLLKPFEKPLLLSAHSHTVWHRFFTSEEGWRGQANLLEFNAGATCGGFWTGRKDGFGIPDASMQDGTPNGYMVMHVDGRDFRFEFHAARNEKQDRYKLYVPSVIEQNVYPAANVSLNFYLGDLQRAVEIRINDRLWQEMRRVPAPDPDVFSSVIQQDRSSVLLSGGRVSEPIATPHMWKFALPTDLPVGEHKIEIRGVDLFGKPLRIESSYRIEKRP